MSSEHETTGGSTEAPPSAGREISRGRKLASGLNAAVVLVLSVLIVTMINYLAYRHYRTFDWTSARYYQLSDQTKKILKDLKSPLRVVVMFSPEEDVYDYVRTLLGEYAAQSPQVKVEFVDPEARNSSRIEKLAKEFKLSGNDRNVVIFQYGDRSKYLKHDSFSSDLVDYDFSAMQMGGQKRIVNYKAEESFTSTILNVTEEKQQKIYFLQGHGEKLPDDPSRNKGLSSLKNALTRQNLSVETLNLVKSGKIPDDCAALILVGPTVPISAPEVTLLGSYLDRKGHLLLMMDPNVENLSDDYGLGELLAKWNVQLGNDLIVNQPRQIAITEQLFSMSSPTDIYCIDYGTHPITGTIKDITTLFPLARSVKELTVSSGSGADRPRVTTLINSDKEAWGESSDAELQSGHVHFDKGADTPGPVPLAVAVESVSPGGMNIGGTRLVVVGNSLCVANGIQRSPNLTFFLNSVNWLLERQKLIGIPPKPSRSYKLEMTPQQFRVVIWGSVVGLPLVTAFLGVLVWWRRRR